MSDFDTRLRARLERLEASVPRPQPPAVSAFDRPPRRRGRQLVLLLAATVGLLAVTSLAALAVRPPPDPAELARNAAEEKLLLEDLAAFEGDACLTPDQAHVLYRQRLDALGLERWSIRDDGRAREAPCVTAGVVGDSQEIILMASMGERVAIALDDLGAELLATCHGRDEAVEALRGTLVEAGIVDPRISVGGVRGVPIDQADHYHEQLRKGCYQYTGANPDHQTGRYTWYLAGP